MTWFLAAMLVVAVVISLYLLRELQRTTNALEACHRERVRERTESERNRQQLAMSMSATASALRDFAHGLRIRRLTRPTIITPPFEKK